MEHRAQPSRGPTLSRDDMPERSERQNLRFARTITLLLAIRPVRAIEPATHDGTTSITGSASKGSTPTGTCGGVAFPNDVVAWLAPLIVFGALLLLIVSLSVTTGARTCGVPPPHNPRAACPTTPSALVCRRR